MACVHFRPNFPDFFFCRSIVTTRHHPDILVDPSMIRDFQLLPCVWGTYFGSSQLMPTDLYSHTFSLSRNTLWFQLVFTPNPWGLIPPLMPEVRAQTLIPWSNFDCWVLTLLKRQSTLYLEWQAACISPKIMVIGGFGVGSRIIHPKAHES